MSDRRFTCRRPHSPCSTGAGDLDLFYAAADCERAPKNPSIAVFLSVIFFWPIFFRRELLLKEKTKRRKEATLKGDTVETLEPFQTNSKTPGQVAKGEYFSFFVYD